MEEENYQLNQLNELIESNKKRQQKLDAKIEYINMDTIDIEEPDIVSQQVAIKEIFGSKPTFKVTCSQSGYSAKMASLVYRDYVAIMNSTNTNYDNRREVYKILYSKITEFSAPKWKPTFEEWLKSTSLGDVETLFYGLYCSTFGDKSTIKFECPYCEEEMVMEINNKYLVRTADRKEMLELTKKIDQEADSIEKIKEFSLITNTKDNERSVKLPDSKIIFTICLPTLWKTLEFLKIFSDEEIAAKSGDAQNVLLSTAAAYLPNSETGKYSLIENKKDISSLLDILSLDDFSVLKEVVTKLLDEKHITYYVENQKCRKCKNTIARIPLDMENLLFFQISEKQLS